MTSSRPRRPLARFPRVFSARVPSGPRVPSLLVSRSSVQAPPRLSGPLMEVTPFGTRLVALPWSGLSNRADSAIFRGYAHLTTRMSHWQDVLRHHARSQCAGRNPRERPLRGGRRWVRSPGGRSWSPAVIPALAWPPRPSWPGAAAGSTWPAGRRQGLARGGQYRRETGNAKVSLPAPRPGRPRVGASLRGRVPGHRGAAARADQQRGRGRAARADQRRLRARCSASITSATSP